MNELINLLLTVP